MSLMVEETALGTGESICPDCGEVTDDFDGIPCDGCNVRVHPGCAVDVELPVSHAGTFCHDCA